MVGTYIRGGLWAIEIHPGGSFRSNEAGTQINESFSLRMCESIFRDLADAFAFAVKQEHKLAMYGNANLVDIGEKNAFSLTKFQTFLYLNVDKKWRMSQNKSKFYYYV